jgi:large exoprotein involved in heme utilization and adhesion
VIVTPTLRLEDRGVIAAIAFSDGRGGNIDLQVGRLTLTGGARIDSGTFGAGQGGTVAVTAGEELVLSGASSGVFSDAAGSGRGGAVALQTQDFRLTDGAMISASSFGTGDAGTIRIQASERFRSQQGSVAATAARAGGGTIEIHAGRLVQVLDSDITTNILGGGGEAGNLTVNAPFVVIAGSQSIANAFEGQGGNLAIDAEVFLADPASRLAASGTLEIRSAAATPTGSIAPLPQAFVDVVVLLPVRCAARFRGGTTSSLVLGGREGLPLDPNGVLPSPLMRQERLAADPAVTGKPHRHKSAARFALLAGHEQALPRLAGDCAK